ncbi:unnamed protein product [Rangifer tarandus platyrhynchus]|uniref:Uncharacterized protein n=1 Tax=Rangifer tarandus platyrhynchus TaxID=3082113 RepID=A0AC59ZCU5_RANTA
MSLACVGSAHRVSATLALPPLKACVLSQSTLLRLQVALQGAGPALRALPRSKPLRFRFSGSPRRRRLGWACNFVPFPGPSSSGDQVLGKCSPLRQPVHLFTPLVSASWLPGWQQAGPSPVRRVSLLGS